MVTINTGISEDDLLAELAREMIGNTRLPGDVDAQQLADATGLCTETCRTKLNDKVRLGELVRIVLPGRRFVYRRR